MNIHVHLKKIKILQTDKKNKHQLQSDSSSNVFSGKQSLPSGPGPACGSGSHHVLEQSLLYKAEEKCLD